MPVLPFWMLLVLGLGLLAIRAVVIALDARRWRQRRDAARQEAPPCRP